MTSLLRGVIGLGANVAFLLSLLLFFGIDSTGVGSRMATLTQERPALGQALKVFARNTRRFLGVTTVFGFFTGFADTLLLALDLPLAILWGCWPRCATTSRRRRPDRRTIGVESRRPSSARGSSW